MLPMSLSTVAESPSANTAAPFHLDEARHSCTYPPFQQKNFPQIHKPKFLCVCVNNHLLLSNGKTVHIATQLVQLIFASAENGSYITIDNSFYCVLA